MHRIFTTSVWSVYPHYVAIGSLADDKDLKRESQAGRLAGSGAVPTRVRPSLHPSSRHARQCDGFVQHGEDDIDHCHERTHIAAGAAETRLCSSNTASPPSSRTMCTG